MPNGGSDCCGNCCFNKAVQEMGHPDPDQKERFWEISHCTVRNLKITNPFWTYCKNFRREKTIPEPGEPVTLKGWIYSSGLYEGYVRIPWHGDSEPVASVSCTCSICGRTTERGIKVDHEETEVGFCTNRHYIDWWKTMHDDPGISSEGYKTPEAFFGEE